MKKIKIDNLYRNILLLCMGIFFLSLAIYTVRSFYYWDEIVYIGMSKYIFFGGDSGLFEMIRPPIVSILLLPFAWIKESPLIVYRVFALLMTSIALIFLYKYVKEETTIRGAVIACIGTFFTLIFFLYSFRISPEIISLAFMFISIFLIKKKKYFWAGIVISLSFLSRFPMGILALSVGIAFTIEYIFIIFNERDNIKKNILEYLKISGQLFIGFMIPTLVYLINNILQNPEKPMFNAAIDPFIYASSAITDGYVWMYEQGYFYYAIELVKQMPILALAPIAILLLIFFQFKNKKTNLYDNILIIFTLIIFIYFSQLAHKEIRYSIAFIPAMFAIIVISIYRTFKVIEKPAVKISTIYNIFLVVIIGIALFFFFYANSLGLFQEEKFPAKDMHSFECYRYLDGLTDEPVVSTTPYVVVFLKNKIVPSYFTMLGVAEAYQDNNYLILTPTSFPCEEKDMKCKMENNALMYNIVQKSDVLFYDEKSSRECIVLSKENKTVGGEEKKKELKEILLDRFSYKEKVELSIIPGGKEAVIIPVLNDIVPLKNDTILQKERLLWVLEEMENKKIPYTIAVIPENLKDLEEEDLFMLQKTLDRDVDVVQKGYSYSGEKSGDTFIGLTYSQQLELLNKGRSDIKKYLFVDVDSFFVPYSESDQNTVSAMVESNFSSMITSRYDPVFTGEIDRYNVGVETVLDWKEMKIESLEYLKKTTELEQLSQGIIVNFYYYTIDDDGKVIFDDYLDWAKERYYFMKFSDYKEWNDIINSLDYKLTEDKFIVKNITDMKHYPFAIIVRDEVNITTNVGSLYVRNQGIKDLDVCINDDCRNIIRNKVEYFEIFRDE